MTRYRDGNLYPTFTKVKRFKEMERKHRTRYQRCLLLDEIGNKHKHLKQLIKQLYYEANKLNNKLTWMNRFAVTYSINIVMNTYKSKVKATTCI